MTVPDTLVFDKPQKLQSILAIRGADWGFTSPVTPAQITAFQETVARHVSQATEIWQAKYRGSDRFFYLKEDKVVVVHLDGVFEAAWRATPGQLAHYRTGVRIK